MAEAGCEIVRVAVPREQDAEALQTIVALLADPGDRRHPLQPHARAEGDRGGGARVRINPGNIGGPEKVAEVIAVAKAAGMPMRIGANSGSLPKHLASWSTTTRPRRS